MAAVISEVAECDNKIENLCSARRVFEAARIGLVVKYHVRGAFRIVQTEVHNLGREVDRSKSGRVSSGLRPSCARRIARRNALSKLHSTQIFRS
jgi:hypothetical protein